MSSVRGLALGPARESQAMSFSRPTTKGISISNGLDSLERESFRELAIKAYPHLARNRKRVLKYVLDHLGEVVFLSTAQLAQKTSVDASTVVRTAREMGFDGYVDFIQAARKSFMLSVSSMPVTVGPPTKSARKSPASGRFHETTHQDIANLQACLKSIDPECIRNLAKRIHRARKILIVGIDFAAALTYYLEYALTAIGLPVIGASSGGGRLRNYLQALSSKDLVIGISHRRCLRATVDAVRYARKCGAFTFALTDSALAPLAKEADEVILAPVISPTFCPSYVAPLSILNALILECSSLRLQQTGAILEAVQREYDEGERWCHEPAVRKTGEPGERRKRVTA